MMRRTVSTRVTIERSFVLNEVVALLFRMKRASPEEMRDPGEMN
jgi:hypothetical protein